MTSVIALQSSGGWNRTNVLLVQSQASLPAATAPEQSRQSRQRPRREVRGDGIEPPLPDSKSGGLPLADPRSSRTRSALRESNPPFQLGRLAPLPLGQGHDHQGGRRGSRTLKAFLVLDRFRGGCHRGHRPAWMPVGRACPSVEIKAAVAGVEPAIVSLTGSCLTVWPHRKNRSEWRVPPSRPPAPRAGALLAELHPESRDDKTAIELFVAGVRGWEAGLRRKLEDGKSN